MLPCLASIRNVRNPRNAGENPENNLANTYWEKITWKEFNKSALVSLKMDNLHYANVVEIFTETLEF